MHFFQLVHKIKLLPTPSCKHHNATDATYLSAPSDLYGTSTTNSKLGFHFTSTFIVVNTAFSALTLLVQHQKKHPDFTKIES